MSESTEKIQHIEKRMNRLVSDIKEAYNHLKLHSTNIESPYTFNQAIDELAELVIEILSLKHMIYKINTKSLDEAYISAKTDKEKSDLKYQKLLSEKTFLEQQLTIIDKAIKDSKEEEFLHRFTNRLEIKRFQIVRFLDDLKAELRIYEETPGLTDNEIDIYIELGKDEITFEGKIYLHETGTMIGNISYRGPHNNMWLGDIGYTISEVYQGHNYAYKALKLIGPLILSKGIEKVYITTKEYNIASQKTIEKFGGKLKEKILSDVLIYECDLKLILESSNKPLIKK